MRGSGSSSAVLLRLAHPGEGPRQLLPSAWTVLWRFCCQSSWCFVLLGPRGSLGISAGAAAGCEILPWTSRGHWVPRCLLPRTWGHRSAPVWSDLTLAPSCGHPGLPGSALRAPQSPYWGSPSWTFGRRQQACAHFICTGPLVARGGRTKNSGDRKETQELTTLLHKCWVPASPLLWPVALQGPGDRLHRCVVIFTGRQQGRGSLCSRNLLRPIHICQNPLSHVEGKVKS